MSSSSSSAAEGVLPDIPIVSNVFLFISDATRWDYLPAEVAEMGATVQTVAASLSTHTSLPTMISGLQPHRHGVFSWLDRIPEIPNLLSYPDYNTGYYMLGSEDVVNDGTFSVLRQDERRFVSSLSEPWLCVERHHGGHAPFHAAKGREMKMDEVSDRLSGRPAQHKEWYSEAIEGTVMDFEDRIERIYKNHNPAETLIVFASDHGEYLGKDSLVGHGSPLRPGGVYVPTVFIHPDIPEMEVDGLMRHVDLFPTILDAIGEPIPPHLDGRNLFDERPSHGYAVAVENLYWEDSQYRMFFADSVWDEHGGIVYNRTSIPRRLISTVGMMASTGWQGSHLRRSPRKILSALNDYIKNEEVKGDPGFTREFAKEYIAERRRETIEENSETVSLSEDQVEQLKGLGYL